LPNVGLAALTVLHPQFFQDVILESGTQATFAELSTPALIGKVNVNQGID
jgi:hypothetical protein